MIFAFSKISAANLRILWRHLPMELRNALSVCVMRFRAGQRKASKQHKICSKIINKILKINNY